MTNGSYLEFQKLKITFKLQVNLSEILLNFIS